MIPAAFPQANVVFGPPPGLTEQQVRSVPVFTHRVLGGSCDGLVQNVVAWKPSPEELEILNKGGVIYLSVLGGLPAHYLSVDFDQATHPA